MYALNKGLGMNVPPGEKLTRFISSKSGFSIANKRVSYRAFIPPRKSPQEISVYRISTLTENKIWEIGRKYVQGENEIKARADFSAEVVYENNLIVITDTQVHELHANIMPLPIKKEDRDEILRELALASELVLTPSE